MPREALSGLEDLNTLDLAYNNIQKVAAVVWSRLLQVNSGEFSNIGGLSELRLEGCSLHEVPPILLHLLSHTKVGHVAFQGLAYLRTLDLQNNLLDKVAHSGLVFLTDSGAQLCPVCLASARDSLLGQE